MDEQDTIDWLEAVMPTLTEHGGEPLCDRCGNGFNAYAWSPNMCPSCDVENLTELYMAQSAV